MEHNLMTTLPSSTLTGNIVSEQQKNAAGITHQNAPTKFIEANGIRYAYRSFGASSGTPLLFLQHFTGNMDNWDPALTDELAKYFPVILLDIKGVGASEGETPATIEEMATDVIAVVKAMKITKVNVLGFSMGGFIGQQIALDDPALINKLILAGTGPKGGEGITDIVIPLTKSTNMTPLEQKLFLFYDATPTSREIGEQVMQRIFKRTVDRDPDTQMTSIQAQLSAILTWGKPDPTYLNRLKQITQPVFVVNGSHDIVVPTGNSYTLFQNLPNARLSLFPDAGHGSIFQYHDLFVSEVVSFLGMK